MALAAAVAAGKGEAMDKDEEEDTSVIATSEIQDGQPALHSGLRRSLDAKRKRELTQAVMWSVSHPAASATAWWLGRWFKAKLCTH